jgi:hypothetical protein
LCTVHVRGVDKLWRACGGGAGFQDCGAADSPYCSSGPIRNKRQSSIEVPRLKRT